MSAGAYLPRARLDRAAIGAFVGSGGGRGTRTVASYDEDTTTMAVEAARLALRSAPEGVETGEVLTTLRESGCDVAQGYLLARPMPGDKLTSWLAGKGPVRRRTAGGQRRPRPINRRSARTR